MPEAEEGDGFVVLYAVDEEDVAWFGCTKAEQYFTPQSPWMEVMKCDTDLLDEVEIGGLYNVRVTSSEYGTVGKVIEAELHHQTAEIAFGAESRLQQMV